MQHTPLLPNKSITVTVSIPISGASTTLKRAEEIGQFLGALTPLRSYTHLTLSHFSTYKLSVIQTMLHDLLNLPSNAGRPVEFAYCITGSNRQPSAKDLIISYANKPWQAIALMFTHLLPTAYRVEDVVFLHQPFNIAVQAIGLVLELPLKLLGSVLTHAINSLAIKREQTLMGTTSSVNRFFINTGFAIVGLAAIIPWALGQVFYTAGNLISYTRKMMDAATQATSSFVAIFTGEYGKTQPTLGLSIKHFAKNFLLILGGGVPLVSGVLHTSINWTRDAIKKYFSDEPASSDNPSPYAIDSHNKSRLHSSDATVKKILIHNPSLNPLSQASVISGNTPESSQQMNSPTSNSAPKFHEESISSPTQGGRKP